MVGGDVDGRVRGHGAHEARQLGVDRLELVTPLPRLAPVDVADLVELPPVEVDERAPLGAQRPQRGVHAALQGGRRAEPAAAQRRPGQA